jgi:hypothetical protein
MSDNQGQVQTFGEAKTSVIDVVQSSFSSLAKMLGIPKLKESFYQNIIYILIVIVIMVGILVYIQMVGLESKSPLFSAPTKEVKKIEIKRVVEGFDANVDFGSKDISNAADVNEVDNNMYGGDGGDDNNHNASLHDGLGEHFENNKRRK